MGKIFGVILILGALFVGFMGYAAFARDEQLAGLPAVLPAGAGAVVLLLFGVLLVSRKKKAPS